MFLSVILVSTCKVGYITESKFVTVKPLCIGCGVGCSILGAAEAAAEADNRDRIPLKPLSGNSCF